MKNKNERKFNYLNNSMQLSQKLFNQNLLQTDYSINNENEKGNNNKTIKLNNYNNLNKSNILDKKKIVVNNNISKINQNIMPKKIFPDYITKTPYIQKNNKSIEKSINNKTIKIINQEKNLNNSLNGKINPYSSHSNEMKDFKNKIKKIKKSNSKERILAKNKDSKINRNLNLTLTNFLSTGGSEIKKNESESCSINNNTNKTTEIIIKRKYTNTTKNKLNKKIFGKININNINYNINDNNSKIINDKSNTNNIIKSAVKRRINKKINLSAFSNDNSSLKNRNYSINKKFEVLRNNLNVEINDIYNNFNKNSNISDKENIKKNELIFDAIQNSFFKFIALLKNPKEKEIAFNIIQKLNEFFKKQENIVYNIIKKNEDLNEKIKKYKETNKNIEKENSLLKEKCDYLNKKIEDMENDYNNQNNLIDNISHNESFNNNIYPNPFFESNNIENEEESSVNTEELESIRFFDKIIMKKHSFSKANIPELQIKKINLKNNELDYKEIIEKNNNKNFNNNKNKKNRNNNNYELKKIINKNNKDFGYTKIAEDKKKLNIKKFRKFK